MGGNQPGTIGGVEFKPSPVVVPIKPASGKVLGIDVSHYEPPVDWAKAKAGGVVKMYTKASEGLGHIDVYLHKHADAAKAAGVQTGAYHFFHAGMDGVDQAKIYLKAIEGMSFELPHCLDWEGSSGDGRKDAKKWLDYVEAATGRLPIIYGGESHFRELALDESFARYPLWMAHYATTEAKLRIPGPWKKLYGWQYTDAETVPGLSSGHHVDANWFYV